MKNLLVFIIVLFSTSTVYCQKENFNWEMGQHYYGYDSLSTIMTFDTPDGEPIFVRKGIMPAFNAFSSISSPEGKLLLSSNGTYAYSYAGNPQLLSTKDGISKLKSGPGGWNGWGGWGGWGGDYEKYKDSASGVVQATIILKQPGQNNNYYIFTTDKPFPTMKNDEVILPPSRGLNYSVVDLNLNEGNGQYSSINTRLGKFATIGQMTAVRHANKKDIWILAVEDSSLNIFAYLLTENGIENNAVISTVNCISASWWIGVMKANIFGDMIAITRNDPWNLSQESIGKLEICKFDNLNGRIESLVTLKIGTYYSYPFGLEFSPDGKMIYLSGWDGTGDGNWSGHFLHQMDISTLDENYIKKNTIDITQRHAGYLQLAPNGKIYVGSDSLRVINKPNLKGNLCEYTVSKLDSTYYWWWGWNWGLPNILIDQLDFQVNPVQGSFCDGQPLILTAKPWPDYTGNQYVWTAPDGKQYNGKTVIIPDAEMSDEGLYKVKMEFNSNIIYDSVYIKVLESPKAVIKSDCIFCYGETFLSAETKAGYKYLWSTGDTTESIDIKKPGSYQLIVTNENLCSDTASIEISSQADLALEIASDKTHLCFDDSTRIYPKAKYHDYLWSTGETTESITVHDAGTYQLIVKNEFGCSDSAEIEIFKNNTDIELNKGILIYEGPLCVGDSQILRLQMTIKTSTDLTISSITTKSNSFEIVNYSSYIRTFKNGEVVNLEIIFKPQDAGIYDDELVFHSTEPCEFVKSIPISASAKQVIELSFGEHYSVAGQILEIPILGEIICPEPQNLTTEYEIEVSFDKEYFLPDDVKFGGIISNAIVGNERIIKIKADGDFSQTKSEINVIFGRALLGRSETSQIKIEDAKLTKDRYFAGFTNGSLNVDGCVNDLSGLQMFKKTSMKVAPNPADGDLKVTVGTQEEGSFSIVIYDFQGREVAKSEFKRSNKNYEENDYTFNISGLGTGVYSVHLTAPWTMKREQLLIIK